MNIILKRNRIVQIMMLFILFSSSATLADAQILVEKPKTEFVCTEDKDMVVGKTTLEGLSKNQNFWIEYNFHYGRYEVDKVVVEQIMQLLSDRKIKITIITATWCNDSKEQFPVFWKVIEPLVDTASIDIICVDRDKLAGDVNLTPFNMELIPAFIFYENDIELGRIVETPSESMEKDILQILSNK